MEDFLPPGLTGNGSGLASGGRDSGVEPGSVSGTLGPATTGTVPMLAP